MDVYNHRQTERFYIFILTLIILWDLRRLHRALQTFRVSFQRHVLVYAKNTKWALRGLKTLTPVMDSLQQDELHKPTKTQVFFVPLLENRDFWETKAVTMWI